MLSPKKIKFRKRHKGRVRGKTKRGARIAFGDFALVTTESAWLTARQIEAARIAATRHMKRQGKLYIRIFPDKPLTKKPLETRMGKGKGPPDQWVAVVKPGRTLYELEGVSREVAVEAFRLAGHKLPVKTKFIERGELV